MPYDEVVEQEKRDRIKQILSEKGIQMNIGGCGCCGSPWITLKLDDDTVIDTEGSIKMFKHS